MLHKMSKKTATKRAHERFGTPPATPVKVPIIITVRQGVEGASYELLAPGLLYGQSVPSQEVGDNALSVAVTRALTSLLPERIKRLRLEGLTTMAKKGSNGSKPPLLSVQIKTTSPTFRKMGAIASANLKVAAKGASAKALLVQLKRFDARWVLLPQPSPKLGKSLTVAEDEDKDAICII